MQGNHCRRTATPTSKRISIVLQPHPHLHQIMGLLHSQVAALHTPKLTSLFLTTKLTAPPKIKATGRKEEKTTRLREDPEMSGRQKNKKQL